ncbi:hypothetical protein TH66_21350 [Carbonactinospora thermoautotrophica]|uniref:MrfA-like Zn-binding domain-containing protein n=1 Tax=Carbonactinospora thermoautotrophica TaxID=1469144 RepID=A0A132N7T2_9ACTN|nr:DUF1998 domain-containing protein [Carbonactinospora thermoautotrophica]KWW97920.1 hypothetical protein TH66_21350 [Carbonactinospora thermoautotrophica]KWX06188.1 hypothetical protein TR74_22775 [Carbonactinospora thermoautotrophica]
MSTGRIRRAQLVTPFGVGAMSILVNGTSVITGGLDHWYEGGDSSNLYLDEFIVDEWRLQERLKVNQLRLPPDHRIPIRGGGQQRNVNLSVPVLRFPRWSFCMYCKRLTESTLSMAQPVRCPDPKHEGAKKRPIMSQVPFVAICDKGHLDDFPWREWVHRSLKPQCDGVLRLLSRGGGTLAGQIVACDCGEERSLERVLEGSFKDDGQEQTVLSQQLSPEGEYTCYGSRPWVADPGSGCGSPLRAALRAAGNVYFPKVESSIFIPRQQGGASAEVLEVLRRPDVQSRIQVFQAFLGSEAVQKLRELVQKLRKLVPVELLKPFSDEELEAGLKELLGETSSTSEDLLDDGEDLTSAADWRRPEHDLLRETPTHPDLTVTDPGIPVALSRWIGRVRRVEVLRETRALRGFTRVRDRPLRLSEGKRLLRRHPLPPEQDWLPAYVVRGEGIYLELERSSLAAWESRKEVQSRAGHMAARFAAAQERRGLQPRDVAPRFVLLHTLAHLLINELIYTCGYSSASLRERLYVSGEPGREMAGLLIYTAAGDSEGTMGGLVRMARPESLEAVFAAALSKARWCSTDPVCMELGEAGQGPDSCNMAACHGCALLPETSCEEFNRFLDRGLVIGTFDSPDLGFFT